jgi:hypothetical protein
MRVEEIRGPISITSAVEERIRRELEARYGPILDEATAEAVKRKELEVLKKRRVAIDMARLKLLRLKDIARLRKRIRREYAKGSRDCPESARKTEGVHTASQEVEAPLVEVYY